MAVQRIEQYRQQNGVDILKVFIKPTRAFPNGGYFYAPADAIDLIQSYSWYLSKDRNQVYVIAKNTVGDKMFFHRELCFLYQNQYADYLDHISHVEFDNTAENLNIVTQTQNQLNCFTRGYGIRQRNSWIVFKPYIQFSGQCYIPYSCVHREDEACQLQHIVDTDFLQSLMGDEYYQFDFKKYRRGSEDILDLERTGVISEEEAAYRHILKYAENAWFYLRYGLEDYFRYYHIPVPTYTLDSNGFMVHSITNQRLCPFSYNPKF